MGSLDITQPQLLTNLPFFFFLLLVRSSVLPFFFFLLLSSFTGFGLQLWFFFFFFFSLGLIFNSGFLLFIYFFFQLFFSTRFGEFGYLKGKKKKATPSDRYGAHKHCEKYWVMRNEWWRQTSRVFKVMSDEWRVMEIEWWKKVIQTPP